MSFEHYYERPISPVHIMLIGRQVLMLDHFNSYIHRYLSGNFPLDHVAYVRPDDTKVCFFQRDSDAIAMYHLQWPFRVDHYPDDEVFEQYVAFKAEQFNEL